MTDAQKALAYAVACIAVLVLLIFTAHAQEHHHPPQDQAIHEKFYSNWFMPDNRSISCCNAEDCSPAESKLENGNWMARKLGREDWLLVPSAKVERERDSPDGRSHLCARGTAVYCFEPGGGS